MTLVGVPLMIDRAWLTDVAAASGVTSHPLVCGSSALVIADYGWVCVNRITARLVADDARGGVTGFDGSHSSEGE